METSNQTPTPVKSTTKAPKAMRSNTPMPVIRTSQTTNTVPAAAASKLIFKASEMKALNLQQADKAIASIRATGKKYRRDVHTTACGILLHWQEHGDWTKLVELASAIGDGMSKRMQTGFYDWVKTFSSLSWNEKSGKFTNATKDGSRVFNLLGQPEQAAETFAFKGALNEPFFATSFGDRPVYSFNFEEALEALLNRAEVAMKRKLDAKTKADAKRIDITPETVTKLEKFAASFGITPKAEAKAA